MPNRLSNWTFDDVHDFLRDHGFTLHHYRGSHHYFKRLHKGRMYMTHVQYHGSKSIPTGTLKGIVRQSGIPENVWIEWAAD